MDSNRWHCANASPPNSNGAVSGRGVMGLKRRSRPVGFHVQLDFKILIAVVVCAFRARTSNQAAQRNWSRQRRRRTRTIRRTLRPRHCPRHLHLRPHCHRRRRLLPCHHRQRRDRGLSYYDASRPTLRPSEPRPPFDRHRAFWSGPRAQPLARCAPPPPPRRTGCSRRKSGASSRRCARRWPVAISD